MVAAGVKFKNNNVCVALKECKPPCAAGLDTRARFSQKITPLATPPNRGRVAVEVFETPSPRRTAPRLIACIGPKYTNETECNTHCAKM